MIFIILINVKNTKIISLYAYCMLQSVDKLSWSHKAEGWWDLTRSDTNFSMTCEANKKNKRKTNLGGNFWRFPIKLSAEILTRDTTCRQSHKAWTNAWNEAELHVNVLTYKLYCLFSPEDQFVAKKFIKSVNYLYYVILRM